MRAEIWLGDVLRALGRTGILDVSRRRLVAGLLSFSEEERAQSLPPSVPPKSVAAPDPSKEGPAPPFEQAPEEPPEAEPDVQPETPEPEDRGFFVGPPARGEPLTAVPVPRAGQWFLTARPPHESLLPPRSERAILQMLLSRPVLDGPFDLPRLVDALARGLPLLDLPRTRVPTSRFGVQVLVDTGAAMAPFAADQNALVERVRDVVGKHVTVVGYFTGTPLRGCRADRGTPTKQYRPPAAGGRVLLVSDLGLGGTPYRHDRPRAAEWASFTAFVRASGCEPVALLPVGQPRLPHSLGAGMPLVSWDRTTTASLVRVVAPWR